MNMNRWPWAGLVDVESSTPQAPWSSCLWILIIFASRSNMAAGAPTIISAFLEERDFLESHTTFLLPPHWPEPSPLSVPNCKVGWECSPLEECMAILCKSTTPYGRKEGIDVWEAEQRPLRRGQIMAVIKDWRRRQANFKVIRDPVAKAFEHEADTIRSGFRQGLLRE